MKYTQNNNPLLLAVDTSAGRSSVVVWRGAALASGQDEMAGQQSRTLLPLVETVMREAGVEYADCTALACAIGPGGFTSVRVGVAALRGVSLAAGKPFIGLSSLESIAYASGQQGDVVVSIDAHRQQFYVQRFRLLDTMPQEQSPPMLVEEAGLKALCHGAKLIQSPCSASAVAALAERWWREGRRDYPHDPLYIREPDAKLPA